MNANETRMNGVKLLALVAVLAMVVCAFAAIMPAQETDAAPSEGTTYLSGDITSTQVFGDGTNVVVTDDLTIPTGMAMVISGTGKLTVNEGATITIEAGGQLIFQEVASQSGTKTPTVVINGNIVASGTISSNYNSVAADKEPTNAEYYGAIVNNTTNDGETGVFLNGSITLERGAELTMTGQTSTISGVVDIIIPGLTDGVTAVSAGKGDIALQNGATINVTKRTSNISIIENQNLELAEGATFTLNGHVKNVTVSAVGSGNYYTAGAVSINNTKAEYTERTTSELTFSVVNQTTPALTDADDDNSRITLRQYVLNVEGTVADGDAVTTEVGTVYNGVNASGETDEYFVVDNSRDYRILPIVSVTGNLTINADSTMTVAGDTYVSISGTVTVEHDNDAETQSTSLTVSGSAYITGTINANYANVKASPVDNSDLITVDGGSVVLTGASVDNSSLTSLATSVKNIYTAHLYGSLYWVEGTDYDTLYICDFDDAVNGASAAGSEEVYVFAFGSQNRTTADEAVDNGAYVVSSDLTIPDGLSVTLIHALVVGEGATLTVEDGAEIVILTAAEAGRTGNTSQPAKLWIQGKLDDYGGAMEDYEDDYNMFIYEVKKTTETDTGDYATYTTLKIALGEATSGDVIDIHGQITISENLTIPADVTVNTDVNGADASAVTISGATLTVNGTLHIADGATVTLQTRDNIESDIVVNNIIANANASTITYTDNSSYVVDGAYFTGTIGDYEQIGFITSPAIAAENSASATTDIYLRGTLSMGDVTFTQGEDNNDLNVYVAPGANITAGTVTLVGADFGFTSTYADGTVFTGTVAFAATDGDVTMAFNRSAGFMFDTVSVDDGASVTESVTVSGTGAMTTSDGYNKISGTVAITSGTVDINSRVSFDYLTVGSGATLSLGDSAEFYAASDIDRDNLEDFSRYPYSLDEIAENSNGLVVDGTLALSQSAKLNWGPVVINGTMTVADGNTGVDLDILDVHGTVTVGEDAKIAASLAIVYGTITGEIDINAMFAHPGSDLASAQVDMNGTESTADVTAYYINGELYNTLYVDQNIDMPVQILVIFSDVDGLVPASAELYSDSDMTDLVYEVPETTNFGDVYTYFMGALFGGSATSVSGAEVTSDYETIYATMDPSTVTGTVSAGTGLDLYIDNVKIEYSSNSYPIYVGTHTVSFNVRAGYDGSNATLTFNGQTIENGATIEITESGFTLVATGAVPSSGTVVIDDGGSDGMGLTDYLLIILVILIVIMAIMVAMRLMRS